MSVKRGFYKRVILSGIAIILSLFLLYFLFQKHQKIKYALPPSSPVAIQTAYVTKIIDGDTIDVSVNGKKERVRLIGIDAPEVYKDQKKPMCFANEALEKAKKLLEGKTIRLESDPTQDDRDTYNRLLRYVFLEDGTNINNLMIRDGFAREYTYLGKKYIYQEEFRAAHKQAKTLKLGLWADYACQ